MNAVKEFDPRKFYHDVGARLRITRVSAGVTQTDLAEIMHLTRTSIANIEAGRQASTLHGIYLAAQHFGCDVDYFLMGGDNEELPGPVVSE